MPAFNRIGALSIALLALTRAPSVHAVNLQDIACPNSPGLTSPNLLQNPGFDGSMAPWTYGNSPDHTFWMNDGAHANSGPGYMQLGSVGHGTLILSAAMNTDASGSTSYYLSFWASVTASHSPVSLNFVLNGAPFGPVIDTFAGSPPGFRQYCLPVTQPPSGNDVLGFYSRDDPNYFYVDDFAVQACATKYLATVTQTATATSSVGPTVTATVTTTQTNTPALSTSTAYYSTFTPVTTTTAAAVATSTVPTPTQTFTACMNAYLGFNSGCCPTQLLTPQQLQQRDLAVDGPKATAAPFGKKRSVAGSEDHIAEVGKRDAAGAAQHLDRRELPSFGPTITIPTTTTTTTTTTTVTIPTFPISIATFTKTENTVAPTPVTTLYTVSTAATSTATVTTTNTVIETPAAVTTTACAARTTPKSFVCPNSGSNQAALLSAQKSYLDQYRLKQAAYPPPNLPNVYVKCAGKAQNYTYTATA